MIPKTNIIPLSLIFCTLTLRYYKTFYTFGYKINKIIPLNTFLTRSQKIRGIKPQPFINIIFHIFLYLTSLIYTIILYGFAVFYCKIYFVYFTYLLCFFFFSNATKQILLQLYYKRYLRLVKTLNSNKTRAQTFPFHFNFFQHFV